MFVVVVVLRRREVDEFTGSSCDRYEKKLDFKLVQFKVLTGLEFA